jgi:hypothetical protein
MRWWSGSSGRSRLRGWWSSRAWNCASRAKTWSGAVRFTRIVRRRLWFRLRRTCGIAWRLLPGQSAEEEPVPRSHAELSDNGVLRVLRRVMFPRSGRSLGRWRRLLLAGARLSTIAIGICLAAGLYHHWYIWIPVAGVVVLFVVDLPVAYREKRLRASDGRDE